MFLFGQPACIDGVVMNGQWGAYRCGASDATDSQPENPQIKSQVLEFRNANHAKMVISWASLLGTRLFFFSGDLDGITFNMNLGASENVGISSEFMAKLMLNYPTFSR